MRLLVIALCLLVTMLLWADATLPNSSAPPKGELDLATWKVPWVAACALNLERAVATLNATGFRASHVSKHWETAHPELPMPQLHAVGLSGTSFDAWVDHYPSLSTSFPWIKNPPGSTGAPFPTTHWLRRDKGRSASFGSIRADPVWDEAYRRIIQPALDKCFN
jgi:hypothetical protein